MDSMYILATQHYIEVRESNRLGFGIDGIYIEEKGIRVIGLNRRIINNTPYARCVFAEELGHYFTSIGSHVPKKFFCLSERMTIDRVEYKALKWAANYLIPEDNLLDSLRDNICEIWELAEHFVVTEEMIKFRIKLFRGD